MEKPVQTAINDYWIAKREMLRMMRRYEAVERAPVPPERLNVKHGILRRYAEDIEGKRAWLALLRGEIEDMMGGVWDDDFVI